MATHRHGTPPWASPSVEGDDRTAEEAALHIEQERRRGAHRSGRRDPRRTGSAAGADDRPPRHYGFADEEPDFGDATTYDDVYVFVDELIVDERYPSEDDLVDDDADDE